MEPSRSATLRGERKREKEYLNRDGVTIGRKTKAPDSLTIILGGLAHTRNLRAFNILLYSVVHLWRILLELKSHAHLLYFFHM